VTAALNQAKLASQFIGEDERHMEQIKMDAKHMLSGRSGKSQRSKPKVQQQGLSKGMDDKTFMQRQLESARRKENSGLDQFKNIPGEFMALLDIDGDGTVDQEEYALMEELENVTGEDVDGDGMVCTAVLCLWILILIFQPQVDDAEHRLAKIRAGRKLLAKVKTKVSFSSICLSLCFFFCFPKSTNRGSSTSKEAICIGMARSSLTIRTQIALK
jgi:hypothetical protein